MSRFRVFFFWEQEKTHLRYTRDYIVEETSAAPILDNTERSGVAADHRGMCKFGVNTEQGFRTTVAALRRYSQEAPHVIGERCVKAVEMLKEKRQQEAMELLATQQTWSTPVSIPLSGNVPRIEASFGHKGISEFIDRRERQAVSGDRAK